jgi:hypothetical protein
MINKLFFLSLLSFNFFMACTTTQAPKVQKTQENIYQSSGFERYILPDIPQWINFSTSAACFREVPIKFLHLKNVLDSYSLNYEQGIQIQYAFNLELWQNEGKEVSPLSFRREETAFYKASELIQANIRSFVIPEFEKINLVWLDSYIEHPEELKKVLSSEEMDEAPPVLLSLCHGYNEMKAYMEEHKLYEFTNRFLSAEILSTFNPKGEREAGLFFYLQDFFGVTKKIQFFSLRGQVPVELRGELEVINLRN